MARPSLRHGPSLRCVSGLLALLLSALAAGAEPVDPAIARGDAAWAARAETLEAERARPERTLQALEAYRAAVESTPEALPARWKLLRALHYAIDFTTLTDDAKDAYVEEAIALVRDSRPLLEAGVGRRADRARLHFWSAIAWGTRAQRVGLLTIVREGVATRMHDDAERSLALDPSVDRGGALRLLSRLHGTLPRVPFVSGWVDRDRALPLAEQGYANDPDHPGNRLILALTLLERAPSREAEARRLLASVMDLGPRPDFRAEDLAIRKEAETRLSELLEEDP